MKRYWNTLLMGLAAIAGTAATANAQLNMTRPSGAPGVQPSNMRLSSWGLSNSQDGYQPGPVTGVLDVVGNTDAVQPAAAAGGGAMAAACAPAAAAPKSNWVVGVQGLYFSRDSEDDVRLSRNGAGDILLSTSANYNTMGGIQTSLTKRNCDGNGLEFVYWGLYPNETTAEILGPGLSVYPLGFADVIDPSGAGTLEDFYNNAESNYAYRSNEFHNFEANLLRNVGSYTTRRGRNATYELLGGFRWFQFNETFGFGAFNSATVPTTLQYQIDVDNTLLGFQLGGRSEVCFTDRISGAFSGKIGVFNNRVNHDQWISDESGNFAYRTVSGVDDYTYTSSKDDLSMLGELDLGLRYRLGCSSRFVCGYRVIGISGIALAPDQIPNDFTLAPEINSINSNGNLIVGGGYAGLEYCF